MKQILRPYILLLMTMFIASCTSEIAEENLPDALSEYEEGVIGIMPELIDGNNFGGSRNALTYDRTEKNMLFSWSNDAAIGVFISGVEGQQKFAIEPATINGLRARFSTPDEVEMNTEKTYLSYSHYSESFNPVNATACPVSFADQVAGANSKMYYYFTNQDEEFANGEKEASRHLDAYDYLVAGGKPLSESHINLQFSRMESIVRFYLKSPAAEVYDSLQLVVVYNENPKPLIIKGKLNMETRTITGDADGRSRVQTLKFAPEGFDMTYSEHREGQPDYPKSEYYNKKSGYIVTFMAMAPVDLTGADQIYLYLISHDGDENKNYYKSDSLAKPNLTPNLFYQWTSANQVTDEPIEFMPVTVQQWENDVLNNDGKGTEGW